MADTENWRTELVGSDCGRYIYAVLLDENEEEIDRYLYEDRMETAYGYDY
jgi:hypothetical protein|tara:strand:+ start:1833 stop:1982 length:150 start_codon:yes stop_codon:yes gene_type:complete